MSLYQCDGCQDAIPAQKARVHCQSCPGSSYDLCASCFITGVTSQNHVPGHSMVTYRTSGFGHVARTPQPPPNLLPLVQRQTTQSPTHPDTRGSATQPGAAWRPFFEAGTWTPTVDYVALVQNIFGHLDSSGAGYIPPEAYSSFLELLGVAGSQNTWAYTYQTSIGPNRESQADFALKQQLDLFGIEYVLHPRQPSPAQERESSFSALLGALAGGQTSQMPLLTLRGFLELINIDVLANPSKAASDLNLVLRTYQLPIWREKGDIPRWCLPEVPVQQALDRANAAAAAAAAASAGMAQNLMAAVQSADETRFGANQIGQDPTYDLVYDVVRKNSYY